MPSLAAGVSSPPGTAERWLGEAETERGSALCEYLSGREKRNTAPRHSHFFHLKKPTNPTATAAMKTRAAG